MSKHDNIDSRLRIIANLGRDPNLRKLGLAYVGYKLTEFAGWIVILIFAYERGGVIESGVAAAAMLVPPALIVPVISTVGDHFPRVKVLVAGYGLMALFSGACAAALVLELPDMVVYGSMLALFTSISFSAPLQTGALVSLAKSAEELTAANVVSGLIESGSYFLGPLLAAALLALAGSWSVFATLSLTMAASAACVRSMDAEHQSLELVERPGLTQLWQDLAGVIRWSTHESDASLLIGLLAGHEVLVGAVEVLVVAIAFDLLGTGDSGAALLNSFFGFGLLGGAIVSVRLVGSRRIGTWLVIGSVLAGIPLVMLAGISIEAIALILLGFAGIGSLLTEVATRTLFQRVIPPYQVTQAFGVLESIGLIAFAFGTVAMAGLISGFGVATGLIVLGLGLVLVALLVCVPIWRLESKYAPPPARALEVLSKLPIFRPLGVLAIEHLARLATLVEAEPGEVLIRQGEEGGSIFVILEGAVEVRVDSVVVRTQGPGDFFGEIAALRGVPRTGSVVAVTRVIALEVDSKRFVQAVSSHPWSLATVRRVVEERELGSDAGTHDA